MSSWNMRRFICMYGGKRARDGWFQSSSAPADSVETADLASPSVVALAPVALAAPVAGADAPSPAAGGAFGVAGGAVVVAGGAVVVAGGVGFAAGAACACAERAAVVRPARERIVSAKEEKPVRARIYSL